MWEFNKRIRGSGGWAKFQTICDSVLRQAQPTGIRLGKIQVVDSVHTVADVDNEVDRLRQGQGKPPRDKQARPVKKGKRRKTGPDGKVTAQNVQYLVIDEAQNIIRDGLRTLHYLMTYVTSDDILLMIILCGQEELAARIERFPEIKSRMYPSTLSSLSREETEELVRYRWMVASARKANPLPFQDHALDAIFDYSKGLPREICKICDLALPAAFADGSRKVDENAVKAVAEGLDLTGGAHGKR